jgi:hypothetical protein
MSPYSLKTRCWSTKPPGTNRVLLECFVGIVTVVPVYTNKNVKDVGLLARLQIPWWQGISDRKMTSLHRKLLRVCSNPVVLHAVLLYHVKTLISGCNVCQLKCMFKPVHSNTRQLQYRIQCSRVLTFPLLPNEINSEHSVTNQFYLTLLSAEYLTDILHKIHCCNGDSVDIG